MKRVCEAGDVTLTSHARRDVSVTFSLLVAADPATAATSAVTVADYVSSVAFVTDLVAAGIPASSVTVVSTPAMVNIEKTTGLLHGSLLWYPSHHCVVLVATLAHH